MSGRQHCTAPHRTAPHRTAPHRTACKLLAAWCHDEPTTQRASAKGSPAGSHALADSKDLRSPVAHLHSSTTPAGWRPPSPMLGSRQSRSLQSTSRTSHWTARSQSCSHRDRGGGCRPPSLWGRWRCRIECGRPPSWESRQGAHTHNRSGSPRIHQSAGIASLVVSGTLHSAHASTTVSNLETGSAIKPTVMLSKARHPALRTVCTAGGVTEAGGVARFADTQLFPTQQGTRAGAVVFLDINKAHCKASRRARRGRDRQARGNGWQPTRNEIKTPRAKPFKWACEATFPVL